MPEIGFNPADIAAFDVKTAQELSSLDLSESNKVDSQTTFTRMNPVENVGDVRIVKETYSIDKTAEQKAKHRAGKESDEELRNERRSLGAQLEEARQLLEKASSNEQTTEAQVKIDRIQSEIDALDREIEMAQFQVIEGARASDEVKDVEGQISNIDANIGELQRSLDSIYQARLEYKAKLDKAHKKLFPHRRLYGWLRNTVGWSGAEASAAKVLEEQEIAKIKQEDPGVDDEAAQELYQIYLKNASNETEAGYKQQIAEANTKLADAKKTLDEKQVKLTEAEGRLAEARDTLKTLIDKKVALERTKTDTAISKAELENRSTREFAEAEAAVKAAEQVLKQAEDEEKSYWDTLKNELLADFQSNEDEIKADVSSQEKQAKREKVRGLFATPERDFLNMVHEIGRDVDGTVSIDTSIQDLSAVTLQLLERYRKLDAAVKSFSANKEIVLAHSMAIVEMERDFAERAQQASEYAKFGVLTESELEEKLKEIDESLSGDKDVQRLSAELVDAKNWLKLPAHRTEAFKRIHKSKIKEKEAIVASHTKDLALAKNDVEARKKTLITKNERQKAKADKLLAEWKSTVLSERVKRRKAEELRAADLFLGALAELTPEERKLATSGELNKAMMEAQAVFDNLLKWASLLENPEGAARLLAETEVAQDRLIQEAGEVVGKIGAELALAQAELKMKRKKADREKAQENIDRLTKELSSAQRRLSKATSEKGASIMKAREAYLPAELASQDIAKSQELQFGTKRAVTDIRRLYTAVMYGGEAHAYDNDIPTAQVTEREGIHEQWASAGQTEFEGLVSEKVTRAKEALARGESKETEGGLSVEQALEKGAEAVRKAVAENPADLAELVGKEGGADRFVKGGGLQALIEGVAKLGGDKAGMIKNLEAQNLVMRALPNGETIYASAIAANTSILGLLS